MIAMRFNSIRTDADEGPACGRPLRLLVAALLGGLACTAASCGDPPVSQYNYPPSLTSIGPVSFDGTSVQVDYTIRDREGDDQSVFVGVCAGSGNEEDLCPTPVQGAGGDGRSFLPTVPRGTDVRHVVSWNVGCGRIGRGRCLETKLDETYRFRIRLEGTDDVVSSERFTLGDEFDLESVPACDTSAGRIPEPCNPNDGDNP